MAVDELAIAALPTLLWNPTSNCPLERPSRRAPHRTVSLSRPPPPRRRRRRPLLERGARPFTTMSRPSVLSSAFHAYGQHPHAHSHYAGAVHHSGPAQLTYRQPQPLPMPPSELASGYNTGLHLHTGHHQHGRSTAIVNMSAAAYLASDDELAQLQKLSNEYEPEATVSA